MKKLLTFFAVLMIFSVAAFTGPFFGTDYDGEYLDIRTGVIFDAVTVQASIAGINTQTPSAKLATFIDLGRGLDNIDLDADFVAAFVPGTTWPWELDTITCGLDGTVNLSPLIGTAWNVELSGNIGLVLDNAFNTTQVWGLGIYIEMPWPTTPMMEI